MEAEDFDTLDVVETGDVVDTVVENGFVDTLDVVETEDAVAHLM